MSKVLYTSEVQAFSWRHVLPWAIVRDLLRYRTLISSMALRDIRATYQASYLGLTWQVLLPVIMLIIFYLVFGRILGGRFSNSANETPLDFALALFVGLGFFNFMAQNIGNATSLISANAPFVKTLSFPLEIVSITSVVNVLVNLLISLVLTALVFLLAKGYLHWSAVCAPFYVLCVFLIAIGISWGLSALSVFIRDVSAVTSPLILILMFMCPIFYPASMVPKNIKWILIINPLAVIIEDVRACLLYGRWPSLLSVAVLFIVSLAVAIAGYHVFMRSKGAFADVM